MLQDTLINKWWNKHHQHSGEVHLVKCGPSIIPSPEQYVDELFTKFKNIPLETVMDFAEAEVTDNTMEDREVLEDASKIHYLRDCIRNNSLNFLPSLMHEPWYDRYRIHPGSGRSVALWLEGRKEFDAILIHFSENNFAVPPTSQQIVNIESFKEMVSYNSTTPYFETYHAFPKIAKECSNTINMDREWKWHHTSTYIPWKFIRWSEGPEFLKHKKSWRSYGIDLWRELQ